MGHVGLEADREGLNVTAHDHLLPSNATRGLPAIQPPFVGKLPYPVAQRSQDVGKTVAIEIHKVGVGRIHQGGRQVGRGQPTVACRDNHGQWGNLILESQRWQFAADIRTKLANTMQV